MNRQSEYAIRELAQDSDLPVEEFGARASALNRLLAAGLPVPRGFALRTEVVREIASSGIPTEWKLSSLIRPGTLVSIRSSPIVRAWGGPETLINVGMNRGMHDRLADRLGEYNATRLYCRQIQEFAVRIKRVDVEDFQAIASDHERVGEDPGSLVAAYLELYEDLVDDAFPEDPEVQLREGLQSMAAAWDGRSARLLREARGAPSDAGFGLIVQEMVLGVGPGPSGTGYVQFLSPISGEPQPWGRFRPQMQGRIEGLADRPGQPDHTFGKETTSPDFETDCPGAMRVLRDHGQRARRVFHMDVRLDFTLENGTVWLLDVVQAEQSARAGVTSAVRLAQDRLITKEAALLSVDPLSLDEVMLSQVDPRAETDVFAAGVAASPGAATGAIVFSAMAAQAMKAREEHCILLRVETSPEDVRGMHSADAILTQKGGMTSHAAVVARGLGVPCVTGATSIKVDVRARTVTLPDDRVLSEGDVITVDGTAGLAIIGAPALVDPDLDGAFGTFMSWADKARTIGVRANSDTAVEARLAREFGVDGVGLVRTEHMFFEPGRLTLMRELILAPTPEDRQAALNRLLPMQRNEFVEMFRIMEGMPVCIRLLDPPLHEFVPRSREAIRRLAEAMDLPISQVSARIEDLAEFNPMLGLRGVRLGITVPEIYDMQARAIFEAAVAVGRETGTTISPEIMVPLVSATREVEIVKSRVDAVAAAVRIECSCEFEYSLGVMVETPRAALRASEIARVSAFFSFGTNDLTQMAYGLSRDDAGRFMREYVNLGVYQEDPFQCLDVDGVGELLILAANRGRITRSDLVLGLCGEHGGDPLSVAFCHRAGFDYVSCSPYRTPVARLAAAQEALRSARYGSEFAGSGTSTAGDQGQSA
ncbi:MAG: PEP-utilizing enzyme [Paracoccaceae bacterium]|nr:PEP-utilizing enzyme [Paracoccaceae bacterium]